MNVMQNVDTWWDEANENYSEPALSLYEKSILICMAMVIGTFLVISAWSGVLVYLGIEEGGGPLGMIARSFCIQALLQ